MNESWLVGYKVSVAQVDGFGGSLDSALLD